MSTAQPLLTKVFSRISAITIAIATATATATVNSQHHRRLASIVRWCRRRRHRPSTTARHQRHCHQHVSMWHRHTNCQPLRIIIILIDIRFISSTTTTTTTAITTAITTQTTKRNSKCWTRKLQAAPTLISYSNGAIRSCSLTVVLSRRLLRLRP